MGISLDERGPSRSLRCYASLAVLALLGLALAACSSSGYARAPRWSVASHHAHGVIRPEHPMLARLHIRGVDVSYYQGDIDWEKLRDHGVTFAYIKATEGGDYLDRQFRHNWFAAKAAGVKRGAYHFYNICRPVRDQIVWFETHVPRDPQALPPALDLEWVPTSERCKLNRVKPSRAKLIRDLRRFLVSIERYYGKRPVIYATASFHRDVLEGAFKGYPFWLRSIDGPPGERFAFRPWRFWQYSAKGSIPGVSGYIDRNVFAGSPREWLRFAEGAEELRADTVRYETHPEL